MNLCQMYKYWQRRHFKFLLPNCQRADVELVNKGNLVIWYEMKNKFPLIMIYNALLSDIFKQWKLYPRINLNPAFKHSHFFHVFFACSCVSFQRLHYGLSQWYFFFTLQGNLLLYCSMNLMIFGAYNVVCKPYKYT